MQSNVKIQDPQQHLELSRQTKMVSSLDASL